MKIIFDVFPLLQWNYTGISQVTLNLVKKFIEHNIDCIYTIGYKIISIEEVNYFINDHSGMNWHNILLKSNNLSYHQFISQKDLKERIYISPHVMSCLTKRSLGNIRFIHDISAILMPQFHPRSTVEFEAYDIYKDIGICDHIFTVSMSSKQEIIKYFNVDPQKITVAYPGVEWTIDHIKHTSKLLFEFPYVLILSTKEPRKNLQLVIKFLAENKTKVINGNLRYIFAGPEGWGNDITKILESEILELKNNNKIFFVGFVPEEFKLSLIYNAQYVIFPSFFEGFGLPVAEALSLGVPVICSYGGSLPEVGGDIAYYFNPYSIKSLEKAILKLEMDSLHDEKTLRQKILEQGKKFSWDVFASIIIKKLSEIYVRKTNA